MFCSIISYISLYTYMYISYLSVSSSSAAIASRRYVLHMRLLTQIKYQYVPITSACSIAKDDSIESSTLVAELQRTFENNGFAFPMNNQNLAQLRSNVFATIKSPKTFVFKFNNNCSRHCSSRCNQTSRHYVCQEWTMSFYLESSKPNLTKTGSVAASRICAAQGGAMFGTSRFGKSVWVFTQSAWHNCHMSGACP